MTRTERETDLVGRHELASELGLHYDMLTKLMDLGYVHASLKVPPGSERAVGYRGNLLFDREAVDRAKRSLSGLRWLMTVSQESWRRLRDEGLSFTLLSKRYARQAEAMRAGAKVLFYVTGVSRIAGLAEISGPRQQKTTLWPSGAYPFRVPLQPRLSVDAIRGAPLKELLVDLEFVKNKAHWEQHVRGTVRLISQSDFDRLHDALLLAASR